jgi:hypothetical protein
MRNQKNGKVRCPSRRLTTWKNARTVEMITFGPINSLTLRFTYVRYARKDTMLKDKPLKVSQAGEILIIEVSLTEISDKGLLAKSLTEEIQRVIRSHKAYEKYVLSQNKALQKG